MSCIHNKIPKLSPTESYHTSVSYSEPSVVNSINLQSNVENVLEHMENKNTEQLKPRNANMESDS